MTKQASRFAALILLSSAIGCSGLSHKRGGEDSDTRYERKARMMKCVDKFLISDVAPSDALSICTTIFSRFEPSIERSIKGPVGQGR